MSPVFCRIRMNSIGYFAGANGTKGFVCYFGEVIKNLSSVYILKGGCGCGKSALMKKIAAEAEKRGLGVERIYCASDPQSLDGVVVPALSVGVVDGTSPHDISPRLPGAADSIINLGECWDSEKLRARVLDIKALTDKKEGAIIRAYSLFAAVGSLQKERDRLLETAVLWEKMSAAAARLLRKTASVNEEFSSNIRLREAFCSTGTVTAPSFGEKNTVALKDSYGIAYLFLEQLLAAAYGKGLGVTVSPSALEPHKIGALLVEDTGELYCVDNSAAKPINLERFLDKQRLSDIKAKLRFLGKAIKSLKEEARQSMAESRKAHLELEAIYTPAMNFREVDIITEKLIKEIFA